MTEHTESSVRKHLEPFHPRICDVIERGHAEWLALKRFMAESGRGAVLYPRTIANFVFDCVVRQALREFGEDGDVRIVIESQTVKFVFGDTVLARFKKGDEDNLGQNQPTQAVFDFVYLQATLPGLPPSAAKVEILYSTSDLDDGINSIIVAARDGDRLLWHYPILGETDGFGAIPLPLRPSGGDDDGPLVIPRVPEDTEREGE